MYKNVILFTIIFLLCSCLSAESVNREQEAFYVAKRAYDDGFYEVALNLFQRFFNNFPKSQNIPEANLYIAQCYYQQNKFIDALNQLEKLASDPAASHLKDRVLYWIGEVHFSGKDYNRAIAFYQRITEEFPESKLIAHAHYSLGWCLFELKEFKEALDVFNKVISSFPDQAIAKDTYIKILECLYKLKDYEGLKENIDIFQGKYPQDTTYTDSIHFLLAEYHFQILNYQQAIQEYQIALRDSSDQEIVFYSHLGIAWCYSELKNYNDAQDLLAAINPDELDDKQKEALLSTKANLFTALGDFQSARLAWSQIRQISTDHQAKIQAYLGEAEALYNLGDYPEAINIYQQAGQTTDSLTSELSDRLYYKLAWAFLKNGQFKEAIATFQKAASFASDEIVKVTSLCQVGDAYQDAKDYDKAIGVYDQILDDYPDSLYVDYVQYQLGLALMRLAHYEKAVLAFSTLLLNFPKSKLKSQAVYSLAVGLFQTQDYLGCAQALRRYSPDITDTGIYIDALHLLGTSLYNQGQFQEAMDVFVEVIRKSENKDNHTVQKAEYEIADCFYQMGKEKEALRRFEILRAKYPDSTLSSEVTWWLGEYYFRRRDLKLSKRYFSTVIRDFPQSGLIADSYYAIGLIEQEQGNLESAIDNFKKAISTGSADVMAQANIAMAGIFIDQGRLNESESAYREAIKQSPALSVSIYPKLAVVYEKREDYDRAIQLYQQAVSGASMKEAAALQFKIARAYERKLDYYQAIEEYLKIPYLYPLDSKLIVKAYLSCAQIYENKQDFLKAKDIYLKVASMEVQEAKYAKERLAWIEEYKLSGQ